MEAGLGISVLPKNSLLPQEEHPFLVTRPIHAILKSRGTIGIVRRRGGTLSPAAERFMTMLIGDVGEGN